MKRGVKRRGSWRASAAGVLRKLLRENIRQGILRRARFDENVSDSVIKEIAKRQPLRAVFRDNSFDGSPAKINVGEIFKMLAPDTRVKVI